MGWVEGFWFVGHFSGLVGGFFDLVGHSLGLVGGFADLVAHCAVGWTLSGIGWRLF
ncbi:hypothetical protein [Sporosarcina sp. E16_8]|uniref:hypothetical protein n=1 Tax=Sporosarcina sp. E16_8 TaxID=2789295 RepID=UPI001A9130E4|nr:hypothetical protein [Sporosarcina sp. E16_8]MBO0589153.1 hypothetical protein [Sporosarcina sp. E16_8]